MNNYSKLEVIYDTSEIDIQREHAEMAQKLSAEVVLVQSHHIQESLNKIMQKTIMFFPLPIVYRLWQDNSMYIEEIVTEENVHHIPNL